MLTEKKSSKAIYLSPFVPYESELQAFNIRRGNGILNMGNLNDGCRHLRAAGFETETINYYLLKYVNTAQHSKETIISELSTLDGYVKEIKYRSGITLSSVTLGISNLAGSYFINNPSFDLSLFTNSVWLTGNGIKLTINDGSKSKIVVAAAVGTGETYSDLIYGATGNGNMETGSPPTGWLAYNATPSRVADERTGGAGSYSINVNRSSANGYCYLIIGCTIGMLYTYGGYIKNISATNGCIEYRLTQLISASGDWTLVSGYRTGDGTIAGAQLNLQISGSVGVDVRFDDVFFRQVLTPSTSGCHFTPISEEASFNPNAASFTITVERT